MARYKIDDTVVDTDKAVQSWDEKTQWDGRNHISVHTGKQWDHQTLYRSAKGRYYLVRNSNWQGSVASAEWLTLEQAARWLLLNDDELPADLAACAEQVSE